jgi:hypothetical protein
MIVVDAEIKKPKKRTARDDLKWLRHAKRKGPKRAPARKTK